MFPNKSVKTTTIMNVEEIKGCDKKCKFQTAGIIIIGDEILKGHQKDENALFLLNELWKIGISCKKVSFVPDNVKEISCEVKLFSSCFDIVFTAGGVGPTHDDVTYAAIAHALGETLKINSELMEIIKNIKNNTNNKERDDSSIIQMSQLPKSAKLLHGTDPVTKKRAIFPLVYVNNIYIFPGIPAYLQKSFQINQHMFLSNKQFHLIKIYLSVTEEYIKDYLNKISKTYSQISLGSYPVLNGMYEVKVTLESEDDKTLESAYNELLELIPNKFIVSVKKCFPNSRHEGTEIFHITPTKRNRILSLSEQMKVLSKLDLQTHLNKDNLSPLASSIKSAWSVLKQTYTMYTPDEVCIGFTGGKDCTVVLHLLVAFTQNIYESKRIGLFLKSVDPFPESLDFMYKCESSYNLQMIYIDGSVKEGLAKLRDQHPNIKAVVMGTRRHDPYSAHLKSFSPTDPDWPQYTRVLPILDWSYCEVWEFLRSFDLPYCSLYNEGYTSLGGTDNTSKNPDLLAADGEYKPAYHLDNEVTERSGRESK